MKFIALNDFLPYIGMLVTLIAWRCERFNTKPIAINLAMIAYIVLWLSLYLADHNPEFKPTSGTVAARCLIIVAELLTVAYVHSVTHKMRKNKKETNLQKGLAKL